jgi:dephospho-CoA kinase
MSKVSESTRKRRDVVEGSFSWDAKHRPMRIGLTGGIGSGKSEVARIFAELGAFVVDADRLAREAVAPGTPALAEIAAVWPGVASRDGVLDRSALGRIVFADDAARRRLNAIVHPRVRALGRALESQAKPGQLVVHVVPLLFEEGFAAQCDATVLVVAPDELRIARVGARDGLDEAAVRKRMAKQIDPERARALAGHVIDNGGDLDALRAAVTEVYRRLRETPAL